MSERSPHTESELVELLQSIDVRAPDTLHRRIQALIDERSTQASRRPLRGGRWRGLASLRLAGASAILAGAIALALVLAGGGSTELSVRETSALTLRPATMSAPAENPHRPGQLSRTVDGVAFPYWEESFGWRSSGARKDHIDGRSVTTVFYTNGRGRRIGYAIVAGKPAPETGGGVVTWLRGTPYRLLNEDGARVIAWIRDGHLCVVAGRGISSATLLRLAGWDDLQPA
jgi:hypothetical protein